MLATSPRLSSKQARLYRTVIRDEFTQPANFAGHYRIAIWGCGTDCRNFAIIDKYTGATYTMPGVLNIVGVMGNNDDRVDFRADSSLLVISGCFNEGCNENNMKAAKFLYRWIDSKLLLIRKCPLPIESIQ